MECEGPNNRLYNFNGLIRLHDEKKSLGVKQVLLRVCTPHFFAKFKGAPGVNGDVRNKFHDSLFLAFQKMSRLFLAYFLTVNLVFAEISVSYGATLSLINQRAAKKKICASPPPSKFLSRFGSDARTRKHF